MVEFSDVRERLRWQDEQRWRNIWKDCELGSGQNDKPDVEPMWWSTEKDSELETIQRKLSFIWIQLHRHRYAWRVGKTIQQCQNKLKHHLNKKHQSLPNSHSAPAIQQTQKMCTLIFPPTLIPKRWWGNNFNMHPDVHLCIILHCAFLYLIILFTCTYTYSISRQYSIHMIFIVSTVIKWNATCHCISHVIYVDQKFQAISALQNRKAIWNNGPFSHVAQGIMWMSTYIALLPVCLHSQLVSYVWPFFLCPAALRFGFWYICNYILKAVTFIYYNILRPVGTEFFNLVKVVFHHIVPHFTHGDLSS